MDEIKKGSVKKRNAKHLGGSMTVEASLLLPLLLSVLLFVITLSVWLYNEAAAVSLAGSGAVLAAGMEHAGKAEIQNAVEAFLSEGKERFPMTEQVSCDVKVSALKVTVTVEVSGRIASPFLWGSQKGVTAKAEKWVLRQNPAEYIRLIRIAEKKRKAGKR